MIIAPLLAWQYVAALVMCHVVGDFAFQSAWMATEKGKSNEVLVYHVVTQAAPFVLLSFVPGTHVTPQGLVLHMLLHGAVDYVKGRGLKFGRERPVIDTIWKDQICHAVCLAFEHAIGWL